MRVRLAEDVLTGDAALGRRVFFNAREPMVSGEPQLFGEGLSCNGCHPDGHDDGHVWHSFNFGKLAVGYRAAISGDVDMSFIPKPKVTGNAIEDAALAYKLPMPIAGTTAIGVPRQTPTLAGRITGSGPFGWRAQNATLVDRILEGFSIHRGIGPLTDGRRAVPWWFHDAKGIPPRVDPKLLAVALEAFLRSSSFESPPRDGTTLDALETRGKELFEQPERGCVSCHTGNFDTDLSLHLLPAPSTPPGFVADADGRYRTPSLRFVGGTPPYFHDGRAMTLEDLLVKDHDSMGTTTDPFGRGSQSPRRLFEEVVNEAACGDSHAVRLGARDRGVGWAPDSLRDHGHFVDVVADTNRSRVERGRADRVAMELRMQCAPDA